MRFFFRAGLVIGLSLAAIPVWADTIVPVGAPTVNVKCEGRSLKTFMSWQGSPDSYSGYYVPKVIDPKTDTTYQKNLKERSTVISGFRSVPHGSTLKLEAGKSYQAVVYANGRNSSITNFSVPFCGSIRLKASNGRFTDRVQLTWQSLGRGTKYEIWRGRTEGGLERIKSGQERTRFDDTTATPGVIYQYRVDVVGVDGEQRLSSNLAEGLRAEIPAPTKPVVQTRCSDEEVVGTIKWTGKPDGERKFWVGIARGSIPGNFPGAYWHKRVTSRRTNLEGFTEAYGSGEMHLRSGSTYTATVFNGTNSPNTVFTTPQCSGEPAETDTDAPASAPTDTTNNP